MTRRDHCICFSQYVANRPQECDASYPIQPPLWPLLVHVRILKFEENGHAIPEGPPRFQCLMGGRENEDVPCDVVLHLSSFSLASGSRTRPPYVSSPAASFDRTYQRK